MTQVLIIFGTRPEVLKLYPLISRFEELGYGDKITILNTGQHKHILDPFLKLFDIRVSHHLHLLQEGQDLSNLTAKAFQRLQQYIDELSRDNKRPSVIVAQGDTTTVMVASMVAFYNKISFAHVEAGLRTGDFENPFPEELNRRIASLAAKFHFAPTEISKDNLVREGIDAARIFVVGNTIVDSIERMRPLLPEMPFSDKILDDIYQKGNIVLITCHRRENHGSNIRGIISAVLQLAQKYEKLNFVWPVHPNPNVKEVVLASGLDKMKNIFITEPINYTDILKLYTKTVNIITDSGGLQEEAPSFGIPVIVVRETTERPEALICGYSVLTGADPVKIISSFENFLVSENKISHNPFGDGKASERIINVLMQSSNNGE